MTTLFLLLIALALYPLLGYPIVVWAKSVLMPRPVRAGEWFPQVSVIIPAYNEADVIAKTVQNKLDQDYPADKLQILVVSDCSDDGTDDIVKGFSSRGVLLVRRAERQGKAAGLNEAIRHASGEIVVFSDANSLFASDAVRRLVENFADTQVGYVTGRLALVGSHEGATSGGSAYLDYENGLRLLETRAGSIVGVNGGCDAMRRAHYRPVPADQITDFVLPLRVLEQRLRVVYDPKVQAVEYANAEMSAEFRMRVRVALRALRGLWYMRAVLNPFRYPWTAFCIYSHKILRYLSFAFLLGGLAVSLLAAATVPLLALALSLQILGYGVGWLGAVVRLPPMLQRLAALPTYFVITNAAFALAFVRFVRGESLAVWRPRGG